MATQRFGHLDDFTLKDTNVGIGTSTPQDKVEIIGGTRSEDLRVAGIATLTSAGGFIEKHLEYVEDQIIVDAGDSGTLSGEIVVGSGQTITVGAAATTSQGTVDALKVYDMFKPPSGGTNQRPPAKPGALFYNFDFKTIEFFDGNSWNQVDNTTRSGRAITGGGLSPGNTAYPNVDLITISTLGNAVNFGSLHTERTSHGACSSSTRGIFLGGNPDNDATEYYTLASGGNGIDFGNLTSTGRRYTSSFSSSTRGFSAGGKDDPAVTNEIDYCEIAQLNTWLDFGDLTVAALYWSGLSSPTRGFCLVADDPAAQTINMVTMASKGDAIDFGNQSKTGGYQAAAANSVRGLWAGGYSSTPRQSVGHSSSIEAITMASQGTTQYFGDLAIASSIYSDGSSTSTRAVFSIGKVTSGSSNFVNNIEYVTIASSGSAADFGDMTFPVAYRGMTSDSHGGLGGF